MNILKFVAVAQTMAGFSKDLSTQVGAIAVDDDGLILASGFNGFPRGVYDDPALYADKTQKYPRVVHAEANCITMAARHGIRLMNSNLIVTSLYPCCDCAKLIIQAGIKRVYAPPMPTESSWLESVTVAMEMFNESGIILNQYHP